MYWSNLKFEYLNIPVDVLQTEQLVLHGFSPPFKISLSDSNAFFFLSMAADKTSRRSHSLKHVPNIYKQNNTDRIQAHACGNYIKCDLVRYRLGNSLFYVEYNYSPCGVVLMGRNLFYYYDYLSFPHLALFCPSRCSYVQLVAESNFNFGAHGSHQSTFGTGLCSYMHLVYSLNLIIIY